MSRLLPAVLLSAVAASPAAAAPFTAADMMKLMRISDPQPSPDGQWVLYTAVKVESSGAKNSDLWLVSAKGAAPRKLTDSPKADTRGRWSPDGKRVAFVSTRDGSSQVWMLDPRAPGAATKVTSLPTEAAGVLWAGNDKLVVTSEVYPSCADMACNAAKLAEDAKEKSSARVYDSLPVRFWDSWLGPRRSHLLLVDLKGKVLRDLTAGGERDVPPHQVEGPDDYAVSPDGSEVCFGRKDDPALALSTNADLWVVPTAGGAPKKIAAHPGYDGGPRYSPDGTRIAYRAQMRGGYESDRQRLMVYERASGKETDLTPDFDRMVDDFTWSRDGKTLYFGAIENGAIPLFSVPAVGGAVTPVAGSGGTWGEVQALDNDTLVAGLASYTHPSEIWMVATDGSFRAALTRMNEDTLRPFRLRPAESVTYTGAAGKPVQAWIVRPSDFDATKKYPLLVLVHGGPQGLWNDGWTYRWNAQVFANAGYVVFAPNPRGSFGAGSEFTDDINHDWGGKAYEDVMKGTDYAESLPYVDKTRTAAAGASYGGYMIEWIAGHTTRFKALVAHDGTFDLEAMAHSTEELFFPEWEFKGPYWTHPDIYREHSPHRFISAFKTPTLVVHGELDYRVPVEQGLGMFTALQRQGVPSRLVVFPDENHWVLKPNNSVRWYKEVLGWLDQWVKP